MEINKALKVRDSLITLSEVLEMEFNQLVAQICFYDDVKFKILKDASDSWSEFENADIVTRGNMLGITITEYNPGINRMPEESSK